AGSGNYIDAQFKTTAPATCGTVSGLTTANITNTSAILNWISLANATGYDVDYKLSADLSWITAAANTPNTNISLSGLTPGSAYDWRVRGICPAGSGNYIDAQFKTTAPATCGTVSGLTTANITNTSATLNWISLANATGYDVDYKLSADLSWITAASNTPNTTISLSGLTPGSAYDWRVRGICPAGSGNYSAAQFTTTDPTVCPDISEPNNTIATAAAISPGIDYYAKVAASGDNDYYSFSNNSSARNIRVQLTNLPADYDIRLFDKKNQQVGISQLSGLANETIILNVNNNGGVGTHKVYVYGFNGAFNNTQCYTLNVQISSTSFINGNNRAETVKAGLKVYPVPASRFITVAFDAYSKGRATIYILNNTVQQVLQKNVQVNDGINFNTIGLSNIAPGVYYIRVNNGKEIRSQKFVISK
ncbi:MAG TPA: fibronectin type III domain-containing protein, partial [Ferruginibacter sp.]|nr:fibronectin type III domain-containing protein [Ferruginibacter sp.]